MSNIISVDKIGEIIKLINNVLEIEKEYNSNELIKEFYPELSEMTNLINEKLTVIEKDYLTSIKKIIEESEIQ